MIAGTLPGPTLADLYLAHRERFVRLASLLVDDRPTAEDVVQDAFAGLHRHRAVVTALGSLPRRQREVLVLRYFAGMSEAEIAEAVGVSRGTVKSTAARGGRALGERLRAEDRV